MHVRTRGHRKQLSLITPFFLCPKTKKKNEGERRNWREHARRCKRTRGRAQSLPFFMLTTEKNYNQRIMGFIRNNYNQRIMGFIRNIMRRYVRISSFFVQKCGEEKRNLRPIQGRTEILRLYFYFSGKIDWKIKDIFLKKENLKGLSTYIYGEKYCLTCKTVWVQFKTVLRRQWKRHRKYDMLFYKGSFETGV
ncbi:MAG: hypothetical protein KHY85_07115 [Clostridium sp.]|nr:hypothetical protein [Clostridium sp.]